MTSREQVRSDWVEAAGAASSRAVASKQSPAALLDLFALYGSLSSADQALVDELLAEQALDEDETVRFDALAIIREFEVVSTLPALRDLAARLERSEAPGAPYQWAKVNRLIGILVATSADS